MFALENASFHFTSAGSKALVLGLFGLHTKAFHLKILPHYHQSKATECNLRFAL
jgi:hypothetical protein